MRTRSVFTAFLLVAGLIVSAPSAAKAAGTSDPWPSPPGANNWSCKPSAAHPRPVILLHGYLANRYLNWQFHSPLIAARGYCVFAFTYGRRPDSPPPVNALGGIVPMEQSAKELGGYVDQVLAATGSKEVDIVGHSEGSLMPGYYVKFLGGAAKVNRYVGLTPLWDGTRFFGADQVNELAKAWGLDPTLGRFIDEICGPCRQFLRGSDFLKKLNEGGAAVPGVKYTMIMTKYDELVQPYTSGRLDGATNIVLQDRYPLDFSGHVAVAVDLNVTALIAEALKG